MGKKYIALYKPYGFVSQFTGDKPEETLSHFDLPPHVYALGRLDKDSEGLLLLTDDGPFKHRLSNPDSKCPKVYLAQVEGLPNKEALQKMEKGLLIKNYKTKPCKVKIISEPNLPPRNPPIRFRKTVPTTWLQITLFEGKNRQIRRMTAAIGYPTLRLVRHSIDSYSLGELNPGEWKEIKL